MGKAIIEIINAVVTIFERLLLAINTTRKFFLFTTLVFISVCLWLISQPSITEQILTEFTTTRIERVDTCYQQSVRLNRRIVAIQYPIPDSLVQLGATQILSAIVIKDYPDLQKFNALCQGLVTEISRPENDTRFFQFNPGLKKRLQEFYLNLDKPTPDILKKTDLEAR